MNNIDEILKQAPTPRPVDPALLGRIARSLEPNLRPVRPIPPPWLLAGGLVVLVIAIATIGAASLGFYGVRNLPMLDRAIIYPVLAILICWTATSCVDEMIPGSRRLVSPAFLLGAASLALLATFGLLFHDYQTTNFVPQGVFCLTAGLFHAVPAGLAVWFVLRRGFAVDPVAAGMLSGTLAGLAGFTMLELHCPNFELFHVILWHSAVVLVSGSAGALLGTWRRRKLP